jgi:hypothetical protein
MPKAVIGIGGKKRAGKSTLADFIRKKAAMKGMVVEEVSFAQPIKDMLQVVFRYEVPLSTFVDDSRKQDKVEVAPGVYMTVRQLLQQVGTDCFRNVIHQDFWVHRGMGLIKASSADIVVVPDVRFANELVALKEIGQTVYVSRQRLPNEPEDNDTHPSEKELETLVNDFDYFIGASSGEVERLETFAYGIVSRICS